MIKELLKKLNIPEIPNDINNLRNYNDLFKLFDISQKIVDNYDKYLSLIVHSEYLKTKEQWKEILSKKDFNKIKDLWYRFTPGNLSINNNPQIFRCNKTNEFIPFIPRHTVSTSGSGGWSEKYKYNKDNNSIIVTMKISIYPYRRSGVSPNIFYQTYEINLLEKSVIETTKDL